MSLSFKETLKFTPAKKQTTGFTCSSIILREISAVADLINWSRNQLIAESILHLIHLIEGFTNHAVPDYIRQAASFQQGKKSEPSKIHFSESADDIKKVYGLHQTAISLNPLILKKVDNITRSIGWSRNAFIVESINHTLNMIKDKNTDPIPSVVKLARAVIPSATFATNSSEKA